MCELSLGLIFLEEEGTKGAGTPSFVPQIPAPRQLSEVWLLWLPWVDNGQVSFQLIFSRSESFGDICLGH